MRILCIGDSLALPREECPYESTWFYQLQKAYPRHEFVDFFSRGLIIKNALNNYEVYYKNYDADVVILQIGICDCSPRYINDIKASVSITKAIFHKIGLESLFWRIVKLRQRRPQCVYTEIRQFESIYKSIIQKFKDSGVKRMVIIKIGHAAPSVLPKNPLMNQNVDRYNEVIDRICKGYDGFIDVINPLSEADDTMFVDGYHCNLKGMGIVFEQLKQVISNYVTE